MQASIFSSASVAVSYSNVVRGSLRVFKSNVSHFFKVTWKGQSKLIVITVHFCTATLSDNI
uniref:Uncharacterized protein n=1 Tax=Anguilla anguilla TaxID=7936 RepID=A0A0E9SXT7_ANGAN